MVWSLDPRREEHRTRIIRFPRRAGRNLKLFALPVARAASADTWGRSIVRSFSPTLRTHTPLLEMAAPPSSSARKKPPSRCPTHTTTGSNQSSSSSSAIAASAASGSGGPVVILSTAAAVESTSSIPNSSRNNTASSSSFGNRVAAVVAAMPSSSSSSSPPMTASQNSTSSNSNTKACCQVRVGVRVRPITAQEQGRGCTSVLEYTHTTNNRANTNTNTTTNNKTNNCIALSGRRFTYDAVFDAASSQADLYAQVAPPLLHSFLHGYNATVRNVTIQCVLCSLHCCWFIRTLFVEFPV